MEIGEAVVISLNQIGGELLEDTLDISEVGTAKHRDPQQSGWQLTGDGQCLTGGHLSRRGGKDKADRIDPR
jgi:hypothetical protein